MRMRWIIAIAAALWSAAAAANGVSPGLPTAPVYKSSSLTAQVGHLRVRVGLPNVFMGGYAGLDAPMVGIKDNSGNLYAISGQQAAWETNVPNWATYQGFYGATGTNTVTITQPGPYNPITPTSNCSNVFKSNWTGIIGASYVSTAPGGYANDQCGNWPVSSLKVGLTYYLFVHEEGPADYSAAISTTDKSLAVFSSTSPMGPWSPISNASSYGTIISSAEIPASNQLLGIGDCTTIPDQTTTYVYAYCMYYSTSIKSNYMTVVGRAPVNNIAPGGWKCLYKGSWSAPCLNNPYNAITGLPQLDLQLPVGNRCATRPSLFAVMCMADDHAIYQSPTGQQSINGLAMAVANKYTGPFQWLPQPLIQYDTQDYRAPSTDNPRKTDLMLYSVLRDNSDGSSVLSNSTSNLDYVWIPPNNGFICRYQIVQPVTFTYQHQTSAASGVPPVGIQLERWFNSGGDANGFPARYRTSIYNPFAPMTQANSSACDATETHWSASDNLGYLLTACPGSANTNQCDANGLRFANSIEGCFKAATDDYMLQVNTNTSNPTAHSCPSGYQDVLRTEGYTLKSAGANTKPLYSCQTTASGYHWASNDSTCFGQTVVGFLGYTMAK